MGLSAHFDLILKLLVLLTLANGSPVIAKRVLGERFAWPLDGGIKFVDGQPLFGRSKTIRGIVIAIVITSLGAPLVGLPWTAGLVVATTAMAGDLFSSFLKRRLRLPPSSQAPGIDQVPESLLPLLVVARGLGLSAVDVVLATAVFFIGEMIVSRALFKLHVRDRPY